MPEDSINPLALKLCYGEIIVELRKAAKLVTLVWKLVPTPM